MFLLHCRGKAKGVAAGGAGGLPSGTVKQLRLSPEAGRSVHGREVKRDMRSKRDARSREMKGDER